MIESLVVLAVAVVSCLVFGAVGHLVGRPKNRSVAGFWLGFILGPLGVVCVLLLPGAGALCPECKGLLGNGARRCMHCGFELFHTRKPKPPACSFCGSLLPHGSSVCRTCGQGSQPKPLPSAVEAAPDPGDLPCPYCGAKLDASVMIRGRNRCGACRRVFDAD